MVCCTKKNLSGTDEIEEIQSLLSTPSSSNPYAVYTTGALAGHTPIMAVVGLMTYEHGEGGVFLSQVPYLGFIPNGSIGQKFVFLVSFRLTLSPLANQTNPGPFGIYVVQNVVNTNNGVAPYGSINAAASAPQSDTLYHNYPVSAPSIVTGTAVVDVTIPVAGTVTTTVGSVTYTSNASAFALSISPSANLADTSTFTMKIVQLASY